MPPIVKLRKFRHDSSMPLYMSDTVRAWVGLGNLSKGVGEGDLIPLSIVEMAEKCKSEKSYSNICHLMCAID